jgi:hypothetical protein
MHRIKSGRGSRLTSAGVVLAGALAVVPTAGAVTTATFSNTGAQQQFVVPAGVTSVHVLAVGGRGGNGLAPGGGLGGSPAEISGDVSVLPGETLYVEVGSAGTEASFAGVARAFNGGTFAGEGEAGGGGASDVRLISRPEIDTPQSLFSRLIVAAGGGAGGAGSEGMLGGAGGNAGSAGESASTGVGGGAGTEEAGGIGACANRGCDGLLGSGNEGNVGLAGSAGGGGGGGLFGGAGGSTNSTNVGAGGGGGSSLQPAGGKTVVPAAATAPEVQISYTAPSPLVVPKFLPPPGPPSPSHIFALLRPIVGAAGSITLVLDLEGPGTVRASATGSHTITVKRHGRRTRRKVHFTYGRASVIRQAGGVLELTIKPSLTGRKALKATKRLPLAVAVTFTSSGASATTKHQSVTLSRR